MEPSAPYLPEILLAPRGWESLQRAMPVTPLPVHFSCPGPLSIAGASPGYIGAPEPAGLELACWCHYLALLGEGQTGGKSRNRHGPSPVVSETDRPRHFQISTLPLSHCVTLGKLFNCLVFPFIKRGLRMPALEGSKF